MKKPTVLRLWAVLCTLVILSACQKETSNIEKQQQQDENAKTRILDGAAPDDPVKVAKVPVIMSREFLSNTQKYMTTPDMLSARSKPVRSGTDATSPSVSITSPTNGSTVSGTVNIQVSATDNVAVASVSLAVDGTTIGTSSTAPYSFSWTASSGTHTIVATAKDAAGNSATNSISVSQNVVSADVTAPTVSITSPASGSTVSGTVSVGVNASDNVGVKSVALSVDGTVVSTLTAAPYNFSWNTTNVADGNHSLSAKAIDEAGNSNISTITLAKNTTITALPPTSLPTSVILVTPTPGSQGGIGSCAAFATVYGARSIEQYYKTGSTTFSTLTNTFSPSYTFNQLAQGSCGSSSLYGNLSILYNQGVCTLSSMPYNDYNGCSIQPSANQVSEAANFKIKSFSLIYTSDITAIKSMIASNHSMAISIRYDDIFLNAGTNTIWKTTTGLIYGSHAILICGYDDSKHAFKIMNSWGTSWGNGGFSWIDYDLLPNLTGSGYVMSL
jgi:hypothetical protein